MILFFAAGRLGNQLFQYAFLKTIAKENEKIVATNMEQFIDKFDIRNKYFKHISFGKYGRFVIRKFVEPFLMLCVRLRLLCYVIQDSALPTFREQKGLLPIRFVETNFFQSEKFFDKTKIDFKIKDKYIEDAKSFLSQISDEYTKIFVHVRRGDYIFESYLGIQGIDLPKSYFEKAIDEIKKEVENPFFVYLSDDSGYVECCFKDIQNKIVSKNSMATDLAIMSLCEYGIVSNSSFSWWGAYLMHNRKKVIMPKYWFGWKSKIESHIDIQPQWAQLMEV
jgi:hypothetical protein